MSALHETIEAFLELHARHKTGTLPAEDLSRYLALRDRVQTGLRGAQPEPARSPGMPLVPPRPSPAS